MEPEEEASSFMSARGTFRRSSEGLKKRNKCNFFIYELRARYIGGIRSKLELKRRINGDKIAKLSVTLSSKVRIKMASLSSPT